MVKLTNEERKSFLLIITEDLCTIRFKVHEQLENLWEQARVDVLHDLGHDKLLERKRQIELEENKLRQERHELEEKLNDDKLSISQLLEFGASENKHGYMHGANFYGIPIHSLVDYKIAKLIQANIDVESPAHYVETLARSVMRELTMAGTFEDAQQIYEDFYKLDFRQYGIDIPPRLKEMKSMRPVLKAPEKPLALPQPKNDEKRDVA
jgi:hypothetical protein